MQILKILYYLFFIVIFFSNPCIIKSERINHTDLSVSLDSIYNETRILLKKADYCRTKNNFAQAEKFINQAEDLAKKHFDTNDLIFSDILRTKGTLYTSLYKIDISIKYINQAIHIRKKLLGKTDSILAYLYNNQGCNYNRNGNFIKAREFLEKSLKIKQLYFDKSSKQIVTTYINLGVISKKAGDYKNALEYYTNAENILQNNSNTGNYNLSKIYNNKAIIYKNCGDYEKAITYYNKALNIFINNYPSYYKRISMLYQNLGIVWLNKNEYSKALNYFNKSINIRKDNDIVPLASSYGSRARCYQFLGNNKQAELNYDMAIKMKIDIYGKNYFALGNNYLNYGEFCIQNFKKDKGYVLYEKALNIYKENFGIKHPLTARCYFNMGDYWLEKNNIPKALDYYQKSIIAIVDEFNEKNIYVNPDTETSLSDKILIKSLKRKADALYRLSSNSENLTSLEMSYKTYEQTIELVEKLRLSYSNYESRIFLSELENNSFIGIVKVAYEMYEKTGNTDYLSKAFIYAEKGKSSVLLSAMRDSEALITGNIPDSLITKENILKKEISYYRNLISEKKQKEKLVSDRLNDWNSKLFDVLREQKNLVIYFEDNFPKYHKMKYDTRVFSPAELIDRLAQDEVIIEYVLDTNTIYLFSISNNNFETFSIPIDSSFFNDLFFIHNFINYNPFVNYSSSYFLKYQEKAYSLYEKLLKPCRETIEGKKLIIIPDAQLNYIPFEALLTAESDKNIQDYGELPYLIKTNSISYSYSATIRFVQTNSKKHSNNKLLAFAPEYNKINYQSTKNNKLHYRDSLFSINGSVNEVKRISDFYKGDIITGKNATENNFKKLSEDYNILHLSMHALINDDNPMFTKLVFSKDTNSLDDGYLNTYEIYDLELNTDLVVLSACKSGYGKLRKGEGVMSLARAFRYAGCSSLIMTLWSVSDNTSTYLMNCFYKFLSTGIAKDDALRMAKLEYIKNASPLNKHPFYWAGYVNIGDTKPIISTKNRLINYTSLLPVIILIFSIVILGAVFRNKIKFMV
ncbi:MAG: CHAT domain-containing protein [Bacteroidales bacterium]|nr:CHAT domain-containing protein [Bacteroidales bacterium]